MRGVFLIIFVNLWYASLAKKLFLEKHIERKRQHRRPNNGRHVVKIHINPRYKVCNLDPRFLSFAVDALEMKREFKCFPLFSKKMNRLAKALSPAYLRVGGTPQDFLTFTRDTAMDNTVDFEEKADPDCKPRFENWKTMEDFVLPMEFFEDLTQFAKRNGLELIFGLNAMNHRKIDHSWDETESFKLFEYADSNNLPIQWELGNEPNRYAKYGKNFTVTPSQLAQDYQRLRSIRKNDKIVGPSITSRNPKALKYLKRFLEGRPRVDALTYHHYFMHQSISTLEKYLDPFYLEELEETMYAVKLVMKATPTPSDLWLGEAGSSSGGGAKNLSNTYAAGFLYLGTLSLASKHCHQIVIRQSFYGGYYGMLDSISHDPLPDYWTSVLFKQLVGTTSLKTYKGNKHVEIQAYCSKQHQDDITLVAINFGNKSARFTINNYERHHVIQYLLTAADGNLRSKHVRLNGKILQLQEDFSLPSLNGIRTKHPFQLPKTSYGFFVVKNVKFKMCRSMPWVYKHPDNLRQNR